MSWTPQTCKEETRLEEREKTIPTCEEETRLRPARKRLAEKTHESNPD